MEIAHHERAESGTTLPYAIWRFDEPRLSLASTVLGGGLGEIRWILNATVARGYDRTDPADHLAALAALAGLRGDGVGMLTAVDVGQVVERHDSEVVAWATVGVESAQWAAAPSPGWHGATSGIGTINVVVDVPVTLSPGALVNAIATATEAKCQAMAERGLEGTGTPTDALCVCVRPGGPAEAYAGPRSVWGARIARAVHSAVAEGLAAGGDRTC